MRRQMLTNNPQVFKFHDTTERKYSAKRKPFKFFRIVIWQEKNVELGGTLQLLYATPLQHSQITRQWCTNVYVGGRFVFNRDKSFKLLIYNTEQFVFKSANLKIKIFWKYFETIIPSFSFPSDFDFFVCLFWATMGTLYIYILLYIIIMRTE